MLQEKRDDVFQCGVPVTRDWQPGGCRGDVCERSPEAALPWADPQWICAMAHRPNRWHCWENITKGRGGNVGQGEKGQKNSVRNSPVSIKVRGGGRGGAPGAEAACGADNHTAAMEGTVMEQHPSGCDLEDPGFPGGLSPRAEACGEDLHWSWDKLRSKEQQRGVIMELPHPLFPNPPVLENLRKS